MGTLDKIVALLNENNKQQKDLMDFLGVSKSTFNKWKKGENKSYLKHVQKIAEFLGTSSACLLRQTLEKSASKNIGNLKQALDTLKSGDNETSAQIIKVVISNLKQQEVSYRAFADEIERKAER